MKLKTKFQDENFELGEVVEAIVFTTEEDITVHTKASSGGSHTIHYNSIKDFTDNWEDAPEEPKNYWIPMSDEPYLFVGNDWETEGLATGLISLSKEENEIKREKLKAWKRLKDKGFRFTGVAGLSNNISVSFETDNKYSSGHIMYDEYSNTDDKLREYNEDLMMLFGGEE